MTTPNSVPGRLQIAQLQLLDTVPAARVARRNAQIDEMHTMVDALQAQVETTARVRQSEEECKTRLAKHRRTVNTLKIQLQRRSEQHATDKPAPSPVPTAMGTLVGTPSTAWVNQVTGVQVGEFELEREGGAKQATGCEVQDAEIKALQTRVQEFQQALSEAAAEIANVKQRSERVESFIRGQGQKPREVDTNQLQAHWRRIRNTVHQAAARMASIASELAAAGAAASHARARARAASSPPGERPSASNGAAPKSETSSPTDAGPS